MSGRAQLIQRSRQVKRRRKIIQMVGLGFLILIAFVLSVYTLHRPRWRIQDVKVIGVKSVSAIEVAKLVDQETSKSYFWLVPRNSRLFYPKKTLTKTISETFPRIADIKLDTSGGRLQVTIAERESELLWCLLRQDDVKDCYFVDITGVAFAKAPNFTDHVLFEVYQKNYPTSTATSSVLGDTVLPVPILKNIYEQKEAIHRVLSNQKVFERSIITSVVLASQSNYSFGVVSPVLSKELWQLLTSSEMSGEALATSLTALFESGSFAKNVGVSRPALSYVDARLQSKVFFKVSENHATTTP